MTIPAACGDNDGSPPPVNTMSDGVDVEFGDVEAANGLGDEIERQFCYDRGYVSFRPFNESDRDQLQELHQEWFPVQYKDEFYDELVLGRMVNTGEKLFTCAAVYHEDDATSGHTDPLETQDELSIKSNPSPDSTSSETDEDYIAACVVGSVLDVLRLDKKTVSLLVSDPFRYKRVLYIMTLGTRTEFRNAGLATTLVQKCISIVEKNKHCGALYLHVITFNTAAIRFYERLGFYRVKEIESKKRALQDSA